MRLSRPHCQQTLKHSGAWSCFSKAVLPNGLAMLDPRNGPHVSLIFPFLQERGNGTLSPKYSRTPSIGSISKAPHARSCEQQCKVPARLRATMQSSRAKLRATMQSPCEKLRPTMQSPREKSRATMLNKEFFKIPEAREDNTSTEIAKSIGTPRREQGESMCHICLVK